MTTFTLRKTWDDRWVYDVVLLTPDSEFSKRLIRTFPSKEQAIEYGEQQGWKFKETSPSS